MTKEQLIKLAEAAAAAKARFSELNDPVKRIGLTVEQMVEHDIEARKALNAHWGIKKAYNARAIAPQPMNQIALAPGEVDPIV